MSTLILVLFSIKEIQQTDQMFLQLLQMIICLYRQAAVAQSMGIASNITCV